MAAKFTLEHAELSETQVIWLRHPLSESHPVTAHISFHSVQSNGTLQTKHSPKISQRCRFDHIQIYIAESILHYQLLRSQISSITSL